MSCSATDLPAAVIADSRRSRSGGRRPSNRARIPSPSACTRPCRRPCAPDSRAWSRLCNGVTMFNSLPIHAPSKACANRARGQCLGFLRRHAVQMVELQIVFGERDALALHRVADDRLGRFASSGSGREHAPQRLDVVAIDLGSTAKLKARHLSANGSRSCTATSCHTTAACCDRRSRSARSSGASRRTAPPPRSNLRSTRRRR